MIGKNRQQLTPVSFPQSSRNHELAVLTSMKPGKIMPLAFIPLLREDSAQGRINVAVEMLETREILANSTRLRVTVMCVPQLALERFQGSRDQFDRSYMGLPKDEDVGAVVVPFVETHAFGTHGSNAVYKAVGLHAQSADLVNTAYLESYNCSINWRKENVSPDITKRARLDATLAPALWNHSRFAHVVPDFDQAVIDGEVALNIVSQNLLVRGPAGATTTPVKQTGTDLKFSANVGGSDARSIQFGSTSNGIVHSGAGSMAALVKNVQGLSAELDGVTAELAADGITVSLSNIELARKTQAFAKMRERYQGLDDEHLIDMLMSGMHVGDADERQPFMVAEKVVRFGQAKRYATDSGNLAESAVSGVAATTVHIKVPRLQTGGVLVVTAEVVPDQLFERQADPFFRIGNVNNFPDALRDHLDPEKVEIVKNVEIDSAHGTPNGTFGYAPLNWKWNAWGPRAGGKFLRPTTDASTDDDRMRIWAMEVVNPTLSASFYEVTAPHQKVFLNTEDDPFEAQVSGNLIMRGNTQFGGMLVEATDNYDKVAAQAPTERIAK